MKMVNVADLKDEKSGKTFRELNAEKKHNIPRGTLVEIISWGDDCDYKGMRMYVSAHGRDCDQTPLYILGSSKEETYHKCGFSGFGEENLRVVD